MALTPYMMRMMGAQAPNVVRPLMGAQAQPAGAVQVPAMNAGVPEDSFARARKIIRETMANVPDGIDPEVAAILNRREQRLSEQERMVNDTGSVWDKLGNFSAALMANESPFFSVGVGRAVQRTLAEEQARRETMRQRRAEIEQAREGVELQRIEQRGAGRRRAQKELKEASDLAGTLSQEGLRAAQTAQARAQAELDAMKADPRFTALDIQIKERQLAEINSRITENLAQAGAANRSGGGGERGKRGMTANQRYNAEQEFIKADTDYQQALAAYRADYNANRGGEAGGSARIDQEKFAKYKAAQVSRERARQLFERTFGRAPAGAGRVVAPTGASTASPSSSGVIDFGSLRR